MKLRGFFAESEREFPVLLAYLFGSRAKGGAGPESDYDIGVLFPRPVLADDRYLLQHLLVKLLHAQVDLVDLSQAPIELVYNVIAAGHLIYEKTLATRVEFEANTMSMYFDQLPVLRARRKEILEETQEEYERGVQRYREALRATERMLAKTRTARDKGEG
ncbi:MAG TPA: nucleotidyltransferase domain-containing protein [Candidatus Acetothermia bacterium]|nr:nucleotidyltransferase domain-containing protein [Candidatus Acetothermia bacterium]